MSTVEWAGLFVSIISIVTGVAGAIRWLVIHYLKELKPNGGESIKDDVKTTKHEMQIVKNDVVSLQRSFEKLDDKLDILYAAIIEKRL